MRPEFINETDRLRRSWMQHDTEWLRDYLVAGVEDPRLNLQSVLSRHFLIESAVKKRFPELAAHEILFATALGWLESLAASGATSEEYDALQHSLQRGLDDAEGLEIPAPISKAWQSLPAEADGLRIPHYLAESLRLLALAKPWPEVRSTVVDLFASLWREALTDIVSTQVRVLEPACGSANDYRFWDRYGIARLIDYQGFDLCEKNIRNARELFPTVSFEVGNVFEIAAPDRACDCCVVHDLYEHLSLEGMRVALGETCRVTRNAICIGFFQMHEEEAHVERPVDDYSCNTLSLGRVREHLQEEGFHVQAIHIETLIHQTLGAIAVPNRAAYTLMGRLASP